MDEPPERVAPPAGGPVTGSPESVVPASERRVILLLAAVQFVNILDFMMPSPLGPRFAAELEIETSSLGIVVASYTIAAGVSGFVGAFFLDRFDRRPALALSLLGLAVGTGGAVLATDLPSLVLARVVAGAFGGPATSLALAIVADVVPVSRRGRALGSVMMAFSLASVFGVPMGLVLAHWGSWHTPFVVTALLCVAAAVGAHVFLPALHDHVRDVPPEQARREMIESTRRLLGEPAVRLAYGMALLSAFGAFMLIPNIAAFTQHNLGYPESLLALLYGAGGIASLLVLRPLGKLVDRVGSFPISLGGAISYAIVTWAMFVALPGPLRALCETTYETAGVTWSPGWLAVCLGFVLFMLTSNARNVAFGTLSSRVPPPELRARYQSLSSMVQHLGLAGGGLVGPVVLRSEGDGSLVGVELVAWISVLALLLVPLLMRIVEGLVDRRDGVTRGSAASTLEAPR